MSAPHAHASSRARYLPLAWLTLAALGAACAAPPAPVPEADVARGREVLQEYKQGLVSTLVAALEESGPEEAIAVCRQAAPQIAARHAADGVRLGRTSHRLRNPANAPEPWMEPLLAGYLQDPESAAPQAVRLDGGTFGYVEPIRMMGFCLSCHGPAVDPGLAATIRGLYPQDQATGFRNGELRGLAWVTMPLGS